MTATRSSFREALDAGRGARSLAAAPLGYNGGHGGNSDAHRSSMGRRWLHHFSNRRLLHEKTRNPLAFLGNSGPFEEGWLKGLEPSTPRSTIWCSNQLSYSHRKRPIIIAVAPPPGQPHRGLRALGPCCRRSREAMMTVTHCRASAGPRRRRRSLPARRRQPRPPQSDSSSPPG